MTPAQAQQIYAEGSTAVVFALLNLDSQLTQLQTEVLEPQSGFLIDNEVLGDRRQF